jgi:AraC family transcriptional regulator
MTTAQMMRREETLAFHGASVEKVVEVLRRTTDRILTLEEMAEIACVSPFHFNRIFHRSTGVSPRRFQCSLRIEQAKRLLVTTDLAPLDVCLECGYSSLGTFTRKFGDMVGWPPQRFREKSRLVGSFPELMAARASQLSETSVPSQAGVCGVVQAPASFQGWIFIAAFADPIPQGMPLACSIMSGPGRFKLAPVRNGICHIMAAGIEQTGPDTCLLHDQAPRAASAPLLIQEGVLTGPEPELRLRDRHDLDVPILLPLGLVLSQKLAASKPKQAAAAVRTAEPNKKSLPVSMLSRRLGPVRRDAANQETKSRPGRMNNGIATNI